MKPNRGNSREKTAAAKKEKPKTDDVRQPKILLFLNKQGSATASSSESSSSSRPPLKRLRGSGPSKPGAVIEEITLSSDSDDADAVTANSSRNKLSLASTAATSRPIRCKTGGSAMIADSKFNFDVDITVDSDIESEPVACSSSKLKLRQDHHLEDHEMNLKNDFHNVGPFTSDPKLRPEENNLLKTSYSTKFSDYQIISTPSKSSTFKSPNEVQALVSKPEVSAKNDHENNLSSNIIVDVGHVFSSPLTKSPIEIKLSPNVSPSLLLQDTPPSKFSSPRNKVNHSSPIRHLRKKNSSVKRLEFQSPLKSNSQIPSRLEDELLSHTADEKEEIQHQRDFEQMEDFLTVITSVMTSEDSNLFSPSEISLSQNFISLPSSAKQLYLRLYKRSLVWYRQCKISYPMIESNLAPVFHDLHLAGFLTEVKEETPSSGLETLLDFLDLTEIKSLALGMQTSCNKSSSKSHCKAELIKLSKTQRTLSKIDIAQRLIDGVLERLGPTFRISESSRNFFSRIFILYCLPKYWEDVTQNGSNLLLTLALTKQMKMLYPKYTISKSRTIFRDREDLLRFAEGLSLHSQIVTSINIKNWNQVVTLLNVVLSKLKVNPEPSVIHEQSLPSYLRVYTAGAVLSRAAWLGVEGHQKLKQFRAANEVIDFLLDVNPKSSHYRGKWHDRKIVNAKHLKLTMLEVKNYLIEALSDPFVEDADRLGFTKRLTKIRADEKKHRQNTQNKKNKRKRGRSSGKVQDEPSENEDAENSPATDEDSDEVLKLKYPHFKTFEPTETITTKEIQAEQLSLGGDGERIFGKSAFLGRSSNSISSVEETALQFYRELGYRCGIHGEGSVPVSIFGLIFWNVIYSDEEVPDAFRCPFQEFPLDLHSEEFYARREGLIKKLLHNLRYNWSVQDALAVIEETWNSNVDKLSIVHWKAFHSLDQVKRLVRSIGLGVIAGISERLAKNFRYYRSGFPDLIVWKETECVFVEVKGPNDKLSAKQIVWLDYLLTIGANAQVMRVNAASNKFIKPTIEEED